MTYKHKYDWEITPEDKARRDAIIKIMSGYTREMEGYSYFGSNPGIPQDDYDEVAGEIMEAMGYTFTEKEPV